MAAVGTDLMEEVSKPLKARVEMYLLVVVVVDVVITLLSVVTGRWGWV